jgi:DNA-directed RNA polymerase specialized sigma24 family protein
VLDPLDVIATDAPQPALLQAEGYSYAEICEMCGWTYTKVNRCLAEGRAKLRDRRVAVS